MVLARKATAKCLLLLAFLSSHILIPKTALANNGPQFIGFSAESTALAGSGHVAVADTSAINTNPAALSLIPGTRFDVTAGFVQAFLHYSDVFGKTNSPARIMWKALETLGVRSDLPPSPGLPV